MNGAAFLLVGSLLLVADPASSAPTLQATDASSQGLVHGAKLTVQVHEVGDGDFSKVPVRVEIRYRASPTPGPSRRIPVQGIAFFDREPGGLEASVNGSPASVRLEPAHLPVLEGYVEVPAPLAAGDTAEIVLSYEVHTGIPTSKETFDLVLPILYVNWKPAGAPADMFQATVSMPAEYSVQEAFPTVRKEMTTRGDVRQYDFQLQVVPSLVRLRGHAGDPPLLTFSRMVDLLVLVLLGIAAGIGWWAYRREQSRRASDASKPRATAPGSSGPDG